MPEMTSTTQRQVSCDFLTSSYRIVGKIMTPNSGVMGVMNDVTSSFMEVLDAKLARLHMPTKLVDHFEVIRVVKSQVLAVCLARREDTGPQALTRGGYVRQADYPIRIATQVYEIEGTLEWAGRFDFSTIMIEGTRDFVPLYNATISGVLISTLKMESPAILFNRKHVDMLALNTHRVKN